MKEKLHPKYKDITVTCACGNSFETKSTKDEIRLEICSACHPFFTGKQKLVDSAGMVDKFQKRMAKTAAVKEAKDTKEEKVKKSFH